MSSNPTASDLRPTMIPADLWAEAFENPLSAIRFDIDGRILWLKKAQKPRGYWRYRFINSVARRLGLPVLASQPPLGWNAAIRLEARRIQELGQAGIRVPELIATGRDWLLISHMGTSLGILYERYPQDTELKFRLAEASLAALLTVHRKGHCLSQCFSRNVVIENLEAPLVGFIDMEEDPLEVMDLPTAQARDILLLMISTVVYFEDSLDRIVTLFNKHIDAHEPAVREVVEGTQKRLAWLRFLPAKKHLGRDFRELEVSLRAFAEYGAAGPKS